MIRCLLVAAALLSSHLAFAQDPPPAAPAAPAAPAVEMVEASGRVIDQFGTPLRGARVSVEGTTTTVLTDKQGYYTVIAPLGASLVVETDKHGASLATVTGPDLEDVVMLLDDLGEEIQITGEAPLVASGAAVLDREEIQRLPGTGGDVVRTLNAMPGVVNTQLPLGYSGVVIRGASPQDSKTLVDDFEIPILFHPFGFRAITPIETIQSLSFVPGAFDVSYGRSSSGIVLLNTRMGREKRRTQAELSLIDGGIIAEGPVGAKTRYMISLRRSVIDLVLPLVIPDSVDLSLTTVPSYWDQQLRVDHELNANWDLTFSTIGTTDGLELYTTRDEEAKAKRFFTQTRFLRATGAARYHEGPWQATLALSAMVQDLNFELGINQKLVILSPTVTPRATVTRTEASALGLRDVVWTAGVESQVGYADVDVAFPRERREGEPMEPLDPNDTSTRFQGAVWYPNYAAWSSLAATFSPRVRVTGGLRAEYFGRPEELALQPRGEVQVKLASSVTARLAAGAYRRPPEYQTELLDKSLQSERSQQNTLGLEWLPLPGVRVQGTVYQTYRSALITRGSDGVLANTGRGESRGAELLAMLSNGKTWFGFLGYSYSRSERTDDPSGASSGGSGTRLFDYDQPHSLNAAASWRRGGWTIGGRFSLYSGLPQTPVVGAEFDSDRNLHQPIYGAVNSDRAETHHQLDIRVDYAWKWGPAALTAFLDVQNVYLNRSVVTYFYGYDYTQRAAFEALPLIPSLGLRGVL